MHTPVRKCNYTVEPARLGQITDYDKLTVEVWTNGSITPGDALGLSANTAEWTPSCTRGDQFRRLGVQDLKGFRNAQPEEKLHILLIIDEFQELFVEDDRIAQEAALLLDRLVRQGRAFGIHVLLGSQTLGGAYSLARSTIGQMAVRIALQCSESDAHLILSEENTAARLLTRAR